MKKLVSVAVSLVLVLALATVFCGSAFAQEIIWWRTDKRPAAPGENTARKLEREAFFKIRAVSDYDIDYDGEREWIIIDDEELNAMAICRVRVDYTDIESFRRIKGLNDEAIVEFNIGFIQELDYGVHPVRVDFLGGQYAELEIEVY